MGEDTGAATASPGDAPLPRRSGPPLRATLIGVAVFTVVLVAGLSYAKWWPYAHKTANVLATHVLPGTSSVTGGEAAPPAPSWDAAWTFGVDYFQSVWVALVAALLIASAMEAFVPRRWLVRVLTSGPRRLGGSAAAGLLAMPSMMCTCCTAPMTVSLGRRGVPPSSALAYWIGNPTLNPAVLVFMAVVLPWQWVGVRIAAGLLLVFLVPPLVARLAGRQASPTAQPTWSDADVADSSMAPRAALRRFGGTLGKLSVTLVPEYIVVVMGIGAIRGWLFPLGSHLAAWGVLSLLLLAITGALFVIPTAGEIPIIQGLLHAGLGAGPVGALVLTLPALSLPSLVMVGRSFSWRVLAALFWAVVVLGVACGVILSFTG